MRTVEPGLSALLRERHLNFVTRVDSWLGASLLADQIRFTDGSITEDATANLGGVLSLAVPATPEWNPDGRRDTHPLGDMGQRLHVTRYLLGPDGERHPIVMGWWRIDESPVEDGLVNVKATELWQVTDDYEFTYPLTPATSSHWQALYDVLADTIPMPATIPGSLTDSTFPDSIYDEDRVQAAVEIIEDLDANYRLDQCGLLELVPDPPTTAVMSFRDGTGGTVATKVPTIGEGASNAFVVRSVPDGEEPPIQAISVLTTGAQKWNGPYGNRPEFYESPLLTSYTRCKATANRMLARSRARQNRVAVTCAPDPRLQAGDLVTLDWTPDGTMTTVSRSKILVDTIEHPLTPDVMSFTGMVIG